MEPWVVEFRLVPRPGASRGEPAAGAPTAAWSSRRPLPADFARRVGLLGLAPSDAGGGARRAWGQPGGNRLELHEVGSGEATVRIAVDVRKPDAAFAAALLALVKASNGVLVRSDGLTIDGTVGSFSRALRSSPAWVHVNDPTGLLTGRQPAGDDDES